MSGDRSALPGIERIVLAVNGLYFDALAAGPESGELVLLLHGFPQFADAWVGLIATLSQARLRAVAVDQRGYSPGARPLAVEEYAINRLASDVLAFADALKTDRFHLVGHDWGGLVAWQVAADHPERLLTLSVLSTPHTNAFQDALRSDLDQMNRSKYILLFKAPKGVPETALLAFDAKTLRGAYQGKVPQAQVEENVRRLSEAGALTAALNWYRAVETGLRIRNILVPTLYVWGDNDMALGETAARKTAQYVDGPYRFERLAGRSHWLLEEVPERLGDLVLDQITAGRGV